MPRGRKKVEVAPQDLLNEVLTSIEETEKKLIQAIEEYKRNFIYEK